MHVPHSTTAHVARSTIITSHSRVKREIVVVVTMAAIELPLSKKGFPFRHHSFGKYSK